MDARCQDERPQSHVPLPTTQNIGREVYALFLPQRRWTCYLRIHSVLIMYRPAGAIAAFSGGDGSIRLAVTFDC